jgi:hypothetical protein
MPLALVAAALADGHTCLQKRPVEVSVVLRLAAVTARVAVQTSAQCRPRQTHLTVSVTFDSLKSVSMSAEQARARSLSAPMVAASIPASMSTVRG